MATFNVELEVDTPSKTKHIHNPSSVRDEKKYIVLNYQIKIIQLYYSFQISTKYTYSYIIFTMTLKFPLFRSINFKWGLIYTLIT